MPSDSSDASPPQDPTPPNSSGDALLGNAAPTRARWFVFALICVASFLLYAHRYSWGVVRIDVQEEYRLSDPAMGYLDSAFNLTYALCQFPGGLAGDVYGPRAIVTIAVVLWSLVMAGPAVAAGFWRLMVVRLVFGVAQAPCYPNLGKVTRSWFPISIRTSIQGFVATLSGRAGGACASLIIASLLMGVCGLTWRVSLGVLALTGFVFAAVFWVFFRNHPAEHPLANEAERRIIEKGDAPPAKSAKPRFNWSKANIRNFGFFLAASFCSSFADNLFVNWIPKFLRDDKGFGDVEMGIFASLPLWGGAVGGVCGGFLNDFLIRMTGRRRLSRSLVAGTGKIVAAGLIAASLLVQDGRMVMGVLFFCKFFSDWSQPTWWGTVTDIGGPAAGRVFGMANLIGSLGATLAGPVMGYVKQEFKFRGLFLFVASMYLATALCWALVDCTRKLVASDPVEPET